MHTTDELQTAIDAAKEGGKIALKYFKTELDISIKKDNTFLTRADIETEEAIKNSILSKYPDASFVAEESGGDITGDDLWIIDPIDGTRVFTRGIAQWSILIAHYHKGEIITGVSYTPTQNILLVAEKGKGAYVNGERVHVSKTKSLSTVFGSFGSLHRFVDINPIVKLNKADLVMRSYEHAYAFSLLVSGKMDFIIDGYGKPWDYAPFICITEEAGGKITDLQGNKWHLRKKDLLATNGILHDEILEIINNDNV